MLPVRTAGQLEVLLLVIRYAKEAKLVAMLASFFAGVDDWIKVSSRRDVVFLSCLVGVPLLPLSDDGDSGCVSTASASGGLMGGIGGALRNAALNNMCCCSTWRILVRCQSVFPSGLFAYPTQLVGGMHC